jgi:hypothetical protein
MVILSEVSQGGPGKHEVRNAYNILFKSEREKPLCRPYGRREDNINIHLRKIETVCVDWIN